MASEAAPAAADQVRQPPGSLRPQKGEELRRLFFHFGRGAGRTTPRNSSRGGGAARRWRACQATTAAPRSSHCGHTGTPAGRWGLRGPWERPLSLAGPLSWGQHRQGIVLMDAGGPQGGNEFTPSPIGPLGPARTAAFWSSKASGGEAMEINSPATSRSSARRGHQVKNWARMPARGCPRTAIRFFFAADGGSNPAGPKSWVASAVPHHTFNGNRPGVPWRHISRRAPLGEGPGASSPASRSGPSPRKAVQQPETRGRPSAQSSHTAPDASTARIAGPTGTWPQPWNRPGAGRESS